MRHFCRFSDNVLNFITLKFGVLFGDYLNEPKIHITKLYPRKFDVFLVNI